MMLTPRVWAVNPAAKQSSACRNVFSLVVEVIAINSTSRKVVKANEFLCYFQKPNN
jgi:hypothetical protein